MGARARRAGRLRGAWPAATLAADLVPGHLRTEEQNVLHCSGARRQSPSARLRLDRRRERQLARQVAHSFSATECGLQRPQQHQQRTPGILGSTPEGALHRCLPLRTARTRPAPRHPHPHPHPHAHPHAHARALLPSRLLLLTSHPRGMTGTNNTKTPARA